MSHLSSTKYSSSHYDNCTFWQYCLLELRQYKNGLVSVKIMLVLKLPPFFPHLHGKGKRAANSKLACVSQKLIRSHIVLALIIIVYFKCIIKGILKWYKKLQISTFNDILSPFIQCPLFGFTVLKSQFTSMYQWQPLAAVPVTSRRKIKKPYQKCQTKPVPRSAYLHSLFLWHCENLLS